VKPFMQYAGPLSPGVWRKQRVCLLSEPVRARVDDEDISIRELFELARCLADINARLDFAYARRSLQGVGQDAEVLLVFVSAGDAVILGAGEEDEA
jgi:hypothetical protein